ncbi:MAG: F0F1 ATP synthase subunit alpha [Clostridia bacterium]|nr:F0F1 ATP synthase subunit alpha [Clostridia bacterium]
MSDVVKREGFDAPEDGKSALKVEILCVTPPSDIQLGRIKEFMMRRYNAADVTFSIKDDPSVIGGFKIFVGDDNYDWSALGRIRQLRKSFQSLERTGIHENIISLLKEDIENFKLDAGYQQVGFVSSVSDGIALIEGLCDVEFGEIVLFECGVKGMVQDVLSSGETGIVLFADESEITEGMKVVRTRRTAGIPISNKILGRMIDPLGMPLDGKGEIGAKEYFPIERPAPGIVDRSPVSRPMETGILTIDSMFPIGRGQRELIIGDRQTGKTSIALDTILNQKGKDVICVYVSIGQKAGSVAKVAQTLKKHGADEYTVIVSSTASDPASMQYIAPYAGCAVAEYFMNRGRDTLIVYDDLSRHAVAYRTLSLLLERSPGREAYPGDVFYLHSRLLERSAQLSDALGGGSMTALPIVETQAGDVSAYMPTNIISITDGQIFLESDLFFAGQRPAVNVGLSVSRVGGAAQTQVMKKSVGSIRLDLAQYREMKVFSQFGGDLDASTARQLRHGEALMTLLKQNKFEPMNLHEQVITLIAADGGIFTDIPIKQIKEYQARLISFFEEERPAVCLKIDHGKRYSPELREEVLSAAAEFASRNA